MSRAGPQAATIAGVTAPTPRTVLCDLDGVVWLAHRPIPGAVEAIARLRAAGCRVLFVTNNSAPTLADHEAALAAIGVDATGAVLSSPMAAAQLVRPGASVLVAGGPGITEALTRRGATPVVNDGTPLTAPVDAVMVGMHRDFDYARLTVAATAVRDGARLIATNADSTYPTPDGLLPGGGSLVAAIATAAGAEPVVAGKPHEPMVALVVATLTADGAGFNPSEVVMVGDRLDTDGAFAGRLGCRFALVRTGVTGGGAQLADPAATTGGVRVDHDLADLAALADLVAPA